MPSPTPLSAAPGSGREGEAMPALPLQRSGFSQRTSSKRAKSVSVE
jgi:hypothetical protein